jgi:hypothetical protein
LELIFRVEQEKGTDKLTIDIPETAMSKERKIKTSIKELKEKGIWFAISIHRDTGKGMIRIGEEDVIDM